MALLSDLSTAKRREVVILACRFALQDEAGECSTYDLAKVIAARLETREVELIGRILASIASKVPQARRGAEFQKYGRTMQRWIWTGGKKPAGPLASQHASVEDDGTAAYEAHCREHRLDPETGKPLAQEW